VDDGICRGSIPEGLFTVAGVTVYYSNGTHYCGFPTMDLYERITGHRDIAGLPDYPAVPASLIFDGVCQG
jgi:hypothetical protein